MAALSRVLLHITTLTAWSDGAKSGMYGADLVGSTGFLHMSTPEQVAGVANALFAGRKDLWVLVIDEARLSVPVVWEPGEPPAPDGSRFPHLYAQLPASAVVAAVPYAPTVDGTFTRPHDLPEPGDHLRRAYALECYLARATGSLVGEVGDAFSVRHSDVGRPDQHNRLLLRRDHSPAEAAALCAREVGQEHWQVHVEGPMGTAAISAYEMAGWSHTENFLMVDSAIPTRVADPDVVVVDVESTVTADSAESLRVDIPRLLDPELRHLVEREAVTGGVAWHLHLVVLDDDGQPLSGADLLVAGATAQLDNVITRPDRRGHGLATAVVLAAVERARGLGCDLVFLRTAADDWPWQAYERLGFRAIATAHVFDRTAPAP